MARKKTQHKTVGCVSAASILGQTALPVQLPSEVAICYLCGKPIPAARIKALKMLGTPQKQWTHATCSVTKKVKGIFDGEVGTSKLILVDKVYNDSVRSVFRRTEITDNDDSSDTDKSDS